MLLENYPKKSHCEIFFQVYVGHSTYILIPGLRANFLNNSFVTLLCT